MKYFVCNVFKPLCSDEVGLLHEYRYLGEFIVFARGRMIDLVRRSFKY